jgi:hypothetical protein
MGSISTFEFEADGKRLFLIASRRVYREESVTCIAREYIMVAVKNSGFSVLKFNGVFFSSGYQTHWR